MEGYLPEKTCRTCLQKSDELTSLHSKDDDTGLTLLDKLRVCASIPVLVSERTPSNACTECVRCIAEYYDFKRRCELSEKTLEDLCWEPSEYAVPKVEVVLKEEDGGNSIIVAKKEPVDPDSSCDDDPSWTPRLDEKDEVHEKGRGSGDKDDQSKSKFVCETCGKRFRYNSSLKRHRLVHEHGPHSCPLCGDRFKSVEERSTHEQTCRPEDGTAELKVSCDLCSKEFKYPSMLARHRLSHSEKRVYECDSCKKSFKSKHDLRKHVRRHLTQKRRCDGCNTLFESLSDMLEHRASAHPDLDPYVVEDKKLTPSQLDEINEECKQHRCDECSRLFTTTNRLHRHKNLYHPVNRHRCDQCGASYAHLYRLRRHLEMHTQRPKFICETCGKAYSFEASLRVHIEENHAAKKPLYVCNVCGKTYNFLGSLNAHKRTHNAPNLRFKCDQCERAFPMMSRLRRHVLTTHEKAHACDACPKRFSAEADLIKHKAFHVREMAKPYECKVCKKRFSTTSAVTFHMNTLHGGKKHLKCDVCGMEFYNRFHYAAHYSGHTGVKPYRCDGCGMGYNYNTNLMQHKKKCASLLELSQQ